jgi:hypothetical protein
VIGGGAAVSTIIVNGFVTTDGEILVSNRIETDQDGKQFIVTEGVYKTETYIEEIDLIETNNFTLHDVHVVEETFSSESKEILYRFIARELERIESQ